MTKTLIAAAISATFAAPLAAIADDDATLWPDKARPTAQSEQTKEQRARTTPRTDEAMSGAAARGSTRPNYDPPLRPNDVRPIPPFRAEPSAASGGTGSRRKDD